MSSTLRLPRSDGRLVSYTIGRYTPFVASEGPIISRTAYAAVHVVCDPLAASDPVAGGAVDWEATLAYRRYLWSCGLGVAEAMDTAQRGSGLVWTQAQDLIRRSTAAARACGGAIACGAGTDHLPPAASVTLDAVLAAYTEQCALVEAAGSRIILMASRALAACAAEPDDYQRVYGAILSQVKEPVILHWLGAMFDPTLVGYWGCRDLDRAADVCLAIIETHMTKVEGIKISLLDAEREIAFRRRLPPGVRLYTGDDFNYPALIRGDNQGYSDALLGIFDPIASAAGAALRALDSGDTDRYEAILAPTVPLARHIFAAPTQYYKTGIVFMAYLNGHQNHFHMLSGQESARSVRHLGELFVLADQAGLLRDPEQAAARMRPVLALAGIQ
ncbi:MAG: dihydrodipicolinate synthase family protein [Chloroflexota bacterium]